MVFMPLLYSVVSYDQRAFLKASFLRFSVSFIMTNCELSNLPRCRIAVGRWVVLNLLRFVTFCYVYP